MSPFWQLDFTDKQRQAVYDRGERAGFPTLWGGDTVRNWLVATPPGWVYACAQGPQELLPLLNAALHRYEQCPELYQPHYAILRVDTNVCN